MSKKRRIAGRRNGQTKRRRWMELVLAALVAIAVVWGVHWAKGQRYRESTDNANVNANIVQVTPRIAATVLTIAHS